MRSAYIEFGEKFYLIHLEKFLVLDFGTSRSVMHFPGCVPCQAFKGFLRFLGDRSLSLNEQS